MSAKPKKVPQSKLHQENKKQTRKKAQKHSIHRNSGYAENQELVMVKHIGKTKKRRLP